MCLNANVNLTLYLLLVAYYIIDNHKLIALYYGENVQ